MPTIVDSVNLISKTMEEILDFVAEDEVLSRDFEQYLEKNDIELNSERQFNNVIVQYMLDMKMQNGLRVLEYFRRNNKSHDEVIDSLLSSFCGVFKIEKILSNAYEAECLTSGAKLEIIPLVKISNLKQVGRYDYILARIVELGGVQYVLEIYDVISEYNPYSATLSAIRYMLLNPRSFYYKNDVKRELLEKSKEEFKEKFEEYFGSQFIITTNKKIDELIERFSKFKETGEKMPYEDLIKHVEANRFLNIEEFENEDDERFLQNAIGGFGSHKEIYDAALWMDKKRGLYVVPFFETFIKCFEGDVEGKRDCIRHFLTNDKIPPSVIKYACDKYENFFDAVNEALGTDFSNLEEVLFNTKAAFVEEGVYSPTTVLFNSDLFSKLMGYKEEGEKQEKAVGRNEPCPCGSGLKYKNCCGKN